MQCSMVKQQDGAHKISKGNGEMLRFSVAEQRSKPA